MSTVTYLGNCLKIKKCDLVNFDLAQVSSDFFEIPNNDCSFEDEYAYFLPNSSKVGIELDYGFTDLSNTSNMKKDSSAFFAPLISEIEKLGINYELLFGLFMYVY